MKNDVVMYEKVYKILKNKIECGLLPGGMKLPSRANLCREFQTSEKTIRRALKMLEQEGFVETMKRRRPVVAYHYADPYHAGVLSLEKADASAANDILKTGVLLCYPVNGKGMALCNGEEWQIPDTIVGQMDPEKPTEFWRLSNRLWRFFISRNENEFILRAVDSLGFAELDPLPGTHEMREVYLSALKELIHTLKAGGNPQEVHFDDLFELYRFLTESAEEVPVRRVRPDSPMRVGTKGLEQTLRRGQERYSSVYLDLLGLIAVGYYQPGERLPSHEELQSMYNVSIDTTIKAIQTLQEWGVVTATRGKGIYVAMDLEDLQKIEIDPQLIASHVRRFLDCLELLSLTIEGVAVHAAAYVTAEEAEALHNELRRRWEEEYVYHVSPSIVLNFIAEHIQFQALKDIYAVVKKDYCIGRSIPKLVNKEKSPKTTEIHRQCMEAVKVLQRGDNVLFGRKAAEMFLYTHELTVSECKRMGYWEAAMEVYDGTLLWK
ncbi:MAG: GntR family transcriptional regulator [Eubacteriales bacterium]|nr:GntR family transcriptional regulator [Eubacteriales bacterium]